MGGEREHGGHALRVEGRREEAVVGEPGGIVGEETGGEDLRAAAGGQRGRVGADKGRDLEAERVISHAGGRGWPVAPLCSVPFP
jgi:hypothetical protein